MLLDMATPPVFLTRPLYVHALGSFFYLTLPTYNYFPIPHESTAPDVLPVGPVQGAFLTGPLCSISPASSGARTTNKDMLILLRTAYLTQ